MIALYRYVKRKREQKKNPDASGSSESSGSATEAPKSKFFGDWRWKLKLAVALAIPIFLETLDYTVVATAQTEIASVFNSLDIQSYIGTVYLLTSTVFLPLFASVADIYGRHAALQIAFLFFIFGSALSTGAHNMETMLAGRGIAGVGAAGLLTAVRTIMADARSLDDNNWQAAILFVLYTIGYSVGPVIGGYLVNASFRWIFAINLPSSVLAMFLCVVLLRKYLKGGELPKRLPQIRGGSETAISKFLRIDWVGTVFFTAGGILILLALSWGSNESWNTAKVIVCFVVGGLLIIACLAWEYILERQETTLTPSNNRLLLADPLLPLEVFRSYDVCTVQYGSFIGGMITVVMFYFVAIFMQIVTGLAPEEAGIQLLYFAPGSGGGLLISMQMIRFLRQPKYPIILGSLIIPISLGLISWAMQREKQGQVNGFMIMAGIGCGLTTASLAVHARFSQPANRIAIVSALTLFFRSLGGLVGLAQCSAVLNAKVKSTITHAVLSGAISIPDAEALSAASVSSLDSISQLPAEVQTIVREAFRAGTRWAFISLIPWAGIALLIALFLSDIRDPDAKTDEGKEEEERNRLTVEMGTIENEKERAGVFAP